MSAQVDLKDVKAAFEAKYKHTLGSWIHSETSGDYRKALMALSDEPM